MLIPGIFNLALGPFISKLNLGAFILLLLIIIGSLISPLKIPLKQFLLKSPSKLGP